MVVAFVGRVVLEKGIDIFTEAFLRAREGNPALRALVVGEGPERAAFAQKLPGGVFLGHQEGESLARAYASADIFFNPSITETFGNVTLEAMACGLPSICAAAAGSKSLVEDGVTGFLATPNATGFAEQLAVLGADGERRRRFGAAARARSADFSWDAVLAELVAHYYEAVETFVPAPAARPDAAS